jgi:hypothetical protein
MSSRLKVKLLPIVLYGSPSTEYLSSICQPVKETSRVLKTFVDSMKMTAT